MQMTDYEVCQLYRHAKCKDEQIVILAQLNGVGTRAIKKILIKHGILGKDKLKIYVRVNNASRYHYNTKPHPKYDMMVSLRANRLSLREIAEEINEAYMTIYYHLSKRKTPSTVEAVRESA